MVCAWKHMAFIVHIQTICPVCRPKACGSWKCWTHYLCSITYLGACRKRIWNFYSAWAVGASEIPDRGNELLNLKLCRERKYMSTVHSSSKHALSQDKKELTNAACSVVSRATVKVSHWKGTRPLQSSGKGLNPLMKQSAEETSVSTARKAGGVVINWFRGNNLAAPEKCLEVSGTRSCSFPAIFTPMEDNRGGYHMCPRVNLLCIKGYRRSDTVSTMVKFPGHLFPQLFSETWCKAPTGWGMCGQSMVSTDQSASQKLLKLRRRHSFSGVTLSQCAPTFWNDGRSLKNFPAVMLSFIQKCKSILPYCLGNLKCMNTTSSQKALLDLLWRQKVAQNLLQHWGDAHTSQESHIHMQITVLGSKQDTHMLL